MTPLEFRRPDKSTFKLSSRGHGADVLLSTALRDSGIPGLVAKKISVRALKHTIVIEG